LTEPARWVTLGAVVRSVAVLLAAMQLSRPEIPRAEALRYADALNQMAEEARIDPLLAVAIVHFESRWYPARISEDNEDYGLGQVRARYLGACREDEDPLNAPSEACLAAKSALLDGVTNLRRMGSIILANKALCKDKVGSEKDAQWLAGYQGYNAPERNQWCKPGDKTQQVLAYHAELVEKFFPKKKALARTSTAKAPAVARAPAKAPAGKPPAREVKGAGAPKPVPKNSAERRR
jgi:hypothetical protein